MFFGCARRGASFAVLALFNMLLPGGAFAQAGSPSNIKPAQAGAGIMQAGVEFTRDVQPLLKAHCFQCHGGTQAQGGLRLETRTQMLAGGTSGTVLVPGNGDKSLLLTRILGGGGKARMPLGFAPFTTAQTAVIRNWINQGAVWPDSKNVKKHWAYVAPVRPRVPNVKNAAWTRNPIDRFILARLEKEGVSPAPEADKITLLRRMTLDLTGLPPTPRETNAFLADKSPNAYEKVVDRLLASPHYGERMALPWLDAARYADSNGFQQDGDTYQYIWRDWVVRAFNANMPFDRFTIEQLAGDLLPNPTDDQKIATAFNRCHLLNGEGGAIAEEQRNVILFDRVDVTATTWLGATLACAQCHDHKYDPLTQKDYYSFMAYFNNVPESGTPPFGGQYRIADPWMTAGTDAENAKLKAFEAQLASAKSQADNYEREHGPELQAAQTAWEAITIANALPAPKLDSWAAVGPFSADSFDTAYDTAFVAEKQTERAQIYADGTPNGKFKWTPRPEWTDGKAVVLTGENTALYLYRVIHAPQAMPLSLSFGSDDAIKVWFNGKPIVANKVTRAVAPDQEKVTVNLRAGDNVLLMKIVNGGGIGGFYFKAQETGLPANIATLLKTPPASRSAGDAKTVRDYFLAANPPVELKTARDKAASAQKELDAYRMSLPRVMIMSDARPRKTHVLQRGNYEMPGEEVTPATPVNLSPLPADAPPNRLGLAQWLVSANNPLTSRVQVNRYWQMFFGTGLVKTSENLGTQSDPPTHSELLDWLAVEFRESGWNVKQMHRLMVTSATYRQTSKTTPALRQRDPENKLLARAARFRLPSLTLRDVALASSGLLNAQIGGKPVYPYQPKGIWDGLAITNERDFTYPQSKGADLFRRSLYTFWRRTVAPANMFDASTRTTCKVRLPVTSTPLYALTTLNDVTWVEAGRALAEHVLQDVPNTSGSSGKGANAGSAANSMNASSANANADARLTEAFRRVCARRPLPDELRVLRRSLDRALAAYRADPAAADAYLKAGDSPRDTTLNPIEHAAYASVCLAIYNLDEALTRE